MNLIYTSASKLKPATTFVVPPWYFREKGDDEINKFKASLSGYSLFWQELEEKNGLVNAGHRLFNVGASSQNLDRLVNAFKFRHIGGVKFFTELGLALGYPADAVEAFPGKEAWSFKNSLRKAAEARVALPLYLAYLTHIPAKIDLLNGGISSSSQEQAMQYQKHVTEHNPMLAQAVKTEFEHRFNVSFWE